MTAGRPVAARAILTAFSTASAPVFRRTLFWSVPEHGRQLGEPPADLDVRLVDPDHEALVEVRVDLLVHRGDCGRKAVTGVLAAEPAGEVDVAATVDVLDPGALGAGDHDRRSGDPARDVALAGGEHPFGGRALFHGHHGGFSHASIGA